MSWYFDIALFQRVSTDTRTLNRGELFFALQGPNFDGHNFVKDAAQKGAIAAVVRKDLDAAFYQSISQQAPSMSLIKVDDTTTALQELAFVRRNVLLGMPLFAITGSCGKTTTRTMLANICKRCGDTLENEANFNNNLGVALTLLELHSRHKFAVIEIGASERGEVKTSTKMAWPNVAVITTVAPVHLHGFGDLDTVAAEKAAILDGLRDGGVAVLNADNKYFDYFAQRTSLRIITFGGDAKAHFYPKNIVIDSSFRTKFILCSPQGEIDIELPVMGQHNIMNALAAAAAASSISEITLEDIKFGLETVAPVPHRMVPRQGKNNSMLIDDSYSANPAAMLESLQMLALRGGQKIFVMGEMAELGEDAEKYHYELGLKAKQLGVDILLAVGELSKHTVKAFGSKAKFFNNQDELLTALQGMLKPDVTVLIKGSNCHHLWRLVEKIADEREILC